MLALLNHLRNTAQISLKARAEKRGLGLARQIIHSHAQVVARSSHEAFAKGFASETKKKSETVGQKLGNPSVVTCFYETCGQQRSTLSGHGKGLKC
jgi:hypothetical protein